VAVGGGTDTAQPTASTVTDVNKQTNLQFFIFMPK
jgi:hypothetical protein